MESHENSPRLPAIKVMVALGQEDLSIKVRKGPPAPSWGGPRALPGGHLVGGGGREGKARSRVVTPLRCLVDE